MNGLQRRKALAAKGIKLIDIAAKLNVSHVAVSHVIHGKSTSARIKNEITRAIGIPEAEIWADESKL